MGLAFLDIVDFRNLISVKLNPIITGFNFIFGNNGSGKTSLLEAIHYLSVGRSFRTLTTDRIVRHSAEKLAIFAQIVSKNHQEIPVGLERYADGEINIRVSGKDIRSVGELADLTPIQLIDSQCHNLLDSGPAFRRKYLDWGIFYQNNDFLRLWKRFERALKQRNAALRHRIAKKELEGWTLELAESATQLDLLRKEYITEVIPLLEEIVAELLCIPELKINYQSGWDQSISYADSLRLSFDRDSLLGYTQTGPHKADLKMLIGSTPAKDILSRGQQKLFVCAMIIARGAILKSHKNKRPIYLIDDLPAELDAASRSKLINLLSKQEAQVFVTAIERENWQDLLTSPVKMFHVEHGEIKEVNLT